MHPTDPPSCCSADVHKRGSCMQVPGLRSFSNQWGWRVAVGYSHFCVACCICSAGTESGPRHVQVPASPDRAILSDPQPSSASTLGMSGPPLNGGDTDHSLDSFTPAVGSLLPPLGLQSPCFPVGTPIWHFTFGDSTLGALSHSLPTSGTLCPWRPWGISRQLQFPLENDVVCPV